MLVNFIDDMGFMWLYCDNYYPFRTNFQAVATVSVMGLISPDIVQTFQKTTCYGSPPNLDPVMESSSQLLKPFMANSTMEIVSI